MPSSPTAEGAGADASPTLLAAGLDADAAEEARRVIAASHARSRGFGLAPEQAPPFDPLSRAALADTIERNRVLHQHAMPVMESLYANIINTHSMVVLTDAHGMILHALGDDDFLQRANKVALAPGVDWSERTKGTNAIGTALAEGRATVVHADQHYLRANHFLTCSAVPIFDPLGKVCGALDVTGDFRSYHQHTMALVRMSGQIIENQLFADAYAESVRVHFYNRPEFIGTLMEGIAAFDMQGRFLAANRSAMQQFGLGAHALEAHSFSSLFGMPVSALFEHYRCWNPGPIQTRLHNGLIVHLRAQIQALNRWNTPGFAPPGSGPHGPAPHQAAPTTNARAPALHLADLDTGDAQLGAVIAKLRKVIDRDIPIMIVGETGTGKELLARAIHQDSARARAPLVAVNCASIPDTLIESELFGYVDGAFTGARKRGQPGKILAANGGTLFLDEIGDMPLALQARLLRVLQERVVTPLGGVHSLPVDVMLVCATHRNLQDLVAQGQFREDLYYRLNALVVHLPALRERTDLDGIIARILQAEPDGGVPFALDPEVAAAFQRYRWPGNFRQLHNALRAAMVLADADHVLRRAHLSDDLARELFATPPVTPLPGNAPLRSTEAPRNTATASAADTTAEPASFEDAERALIERTLQAQGGNVSAAARVLGVSRSTLYRRLAREQRD